MRRILVAAVTTAALALPGVALAHGGEHDRGAEHHGVGHAERHHHRHHRRAHLVAFHAQAPVTAPSAGESTSPSPPVAGERAGTIASFTGGTLTITLNDGTSVSGKVTPATRIECHPALASAADHGDSGDNDGADEHGGRSGPGAGDGRPSDGSGHDEGDHDAGDDDAHDEAEHCPPTALVPGASIREAVLSVGGAGAFWAELEL
jgi:hypothetical protein